MLVLTLTKMFELNGGQYSILSDSFNFRVWVMERTWDMNKKGVSCVPRDEYTLERHNGERYTQTFALIGDGVAHFPDEGKPRSACVFHYARKPTHLAGCLAPAESILPNGWTVESMEATERTLALFEDYIADGIKILCQ